ncbi:DUF2726 domain-containing protein [Paludibacterium denitrificans]|uniref:DUF2726 domain-containing protein n=1 Tax=Paludibacterium denitrificans TaxID=2675226 RepID=A0A844GGV7_9NEIS|nr:DUF2726 domain-containing protein [Paludibacterium denitrificans]MTD33904.1 DUF2726 domain-containing protein [Paludibacterium denitrificans]
MKIFPLFLLLLSELALATAYTCVDSVGHTTYSDHPDCTAPQKTFPRRESGSYVATPVSPQGVSTFSSSPGQPVQPQVVTPQQALPRISFPPIFYLLLGFVFLVLFASAFLVGQTNRKRRRRNFPSFPDLDQPRGKVSQMDDFRQLDVRPKTTDYGSARFTLKNPALLTEREQGCYWRLVNALGPDFIVMGQVAFSQMLTVKGGTGYQNHALFSTMRQKVADFVICRKDFTMIAVVELDDSSHANKRDKDKIRDRAIKEAGLLVFRLPSTPNHEPVERLADVLKRLDQLQTV